MKRCPNMNPICIFHRSDLDGVCSAAIVKHFVPDCELYGIDYGEEFPWDKVRPGPDAENDPLWSHLFKPENGYEGPEQYGGYAVEKLRFEKRTVYMVDFSLPPGDMKRLAEVCDLIWIDHHKSCEELWNEMSHTGVITGGSFSTKFAACELTWFMFESYKREIESAFHPQFKVDTDTPMELPEAVRLLGRYDVWDKGNPEWASRILPFQYGMRVQEGAYDPESELWPRVMDPTDEDIERGYMVEYGFAILRYQAGQNRRACEAGAHEVLLSYATKDSATFDDPKAKFSRWLDEPHKALFSIEGSHSQYWPSRHCFRLLACNTIVFNSQFFDGFYDPEKHDVMCAYCQLASGKWKVSLYSTKPEIDCGAICKTFGGGGHVGAAGFICDRLPWEN